MTKRNLYKIYFSILLLLATVSLQAQSYNNEWIDYTKTYYKFKVGTDGLYRINASSLAGISLSSIAAGQFQLWRNGVQVPIYTSTTGVLGSNDYIEFWGEHNDGTADAPLFKNPDDQLNKSDCFETDSATYFLTANSNTTQNLHYTNAVNDVGNKPSGLAAEPYFMYTIQKDLGTEFNKGPAKDYGSDYVYQSDYKGKAFGKVITPTGDVMAAFTDLAAYVSGSVKSTLSVGVAGSSVLGVSRTISITGTDGSALSQPLAKFETRVLANDQVNITGNYTATIKVINSNTNDRVTVSFASLRYPRTFDFGNQTGFAFELPAGMQQRYLEITRFNAAGSTPVLYDITNGKRYTAVVSGTTYQFLLPVMGAAKLVLVGQATSSYTTISAGRMTQRIFPDLSNADNQGDYLIISSKVLYSGNYVQQYADYRSSAAGGAYRTKIYNIDDLEDMFAWGIRSSPLSIRNFLRYARGKFSVKPKFVFIIGRGLTFDNMRGANESNPDYVSQNLVPTYGWPASDIMLVSDGFEPIAGTPVGRLSAVKPDEIKNYLDKVKSYEQTQTTDDNTVGNNAWKKNVLYISGGGNTSEDNLFSGYLNSYKSILNDTLYGANTYYLSKITADQVSSSSADGLKALFSKGLSLISYFGHGASTTIGYGELSDPSIFNNNNRYPVVFTSGCDVGDCYTYMPDRATTINNITERYMFTKDKGSVGFVAETYLGVTSFLHNYNLILYRDLATTKYGQPISQCLIDGQKAMIAPGGAVNSDSITAYAHAEQTNFFGDPAISLNSFAKPDFAIEETQIFTPQSVSITESKFHIKAYLYNLGRAQGDSVQVEIKRQFPDGTDEILLSKNIKSVRYIDSIELDVLIDPNRDAGNNNIIITIDGENKFDELSESNNTITKTVFVYANGITPVYPYNYSIIHTQGAHLVASTSDALAPMTNYVMEIDTSTLFNSSFKVTKSVSAIGGAIDFDPGVSYTDSTVYYWRVSPVPASGSDYRWAGSSFQYITGSNDGAGESHLYQHLQSVMERISLDSVNRMWTFNNIVYNLLVPHAVMGGGNNIGLSNFGVKINNIGISNYYCTDLGNSIIFIILTSDGLKPYYNQAQPSIVENGSIGGFMGSTAACGSTPYSYDRDPIQFPNVNKYNFQFSFQTKADRDNIAKFMDWIPKDAYVVARIFVTEPFNTVPLIDDWKADGTGSNTLYNKFINKGLSYIDQFISPKAAVFVYKNDDDSFIPLQEMTENVSGQIQLSQNLIAKDSLGYITSPKFGPAKTWQSVQWNGKSLDAVNTDNATIEVIGINPQGQGSVLHTLTTAQQNFDISNVDAAAYPYIQLKMRNADSINYTPYQLRYWHVLYTPVPEGALAGNILLDSKDTLALGQDLHFAIAFKNVSDQVFADSILTNVTLRDKNNKVYEIPVRSLKKIQPGDTALINITIPGDTSIYNSTRPLLEQMPVGTINLTGSNTLSLDINPGNAQPEAWHENNFLFKNFYVKSDVHNPLLDVTFDGLHILDNDIVAAKPNVTIRLNDDSKYLLLNDTSVAQISLKYPDGSIRRFGYNSDTLSFSPARDSSNNEAVIDFRPYLTQDGTYELIVQGQGKTGAVATATDYSVSFQVYNKPMISDMFNYPNPFTSSTAFVFTITGSQVPQNIRIQIMTITGKIVKEITKAELGSLHIGRNITDYKWDGTDNFGQKLANGVYLYRVITNQDGKRLDRFTIKDVNGNEVNTGKYFNKGYGKMYLMR